MAKERINISLSEDTRNRLKAYAEAMHTNVSQAITDWIWNTEIEEKPDRKKAGDYGGEKPGD